MQETKVSWDNLIECQTTTPITTNYISKNTLIFMLSYRIFSIKLKFSQAVDFKRGGWWT